MDRALAYVPSSDARMVHEPMDLDLTHAQRVGGLIRTLAEHNGEHCLSEYSFTNLWLFRREHRYRFTDGPWPFISGLTYDGAHHAMPLFALDSAPPEVLDHLLRHHDFLYPVPRSQAQRLDQARYLHNDCRDDADYVYPADQFRFYRGELLNKKRNLMKQLLRAHIVQAEPYGPEWHGRALAVLDGWMADKGRPAGGADERPCLDALAAAAPLGLEGYGYTVDGLPAGFVLAEPLQPGVYAMRFAKCLRRFKGLPQYMFHHFCIERVEACWLNFEQDLGLPNFRQTKLSYQPGALLNKCRVMSRR